MNKTEAVYKWLESGNSITQTEAYERFGTTRLSAIIFNLRRRGVPIVTVDEEGTDRFGNACRWGRYRISRED